MFWCSINQSILSSAQCEIFDIFVSRDFFIFYSTKLLSTGDLGSAIYLKILSIFGFHFARKLY